MSDQVIPSQLFFGPPPTPGQQIYVDLMEEARIRIHMMRDAINDRNSWFPRILQEFVYLQLRTLCEIVALGCLVAHGDIKKRDTLKRWDIPAIMKEMEKLNPEFYPRPVRTQILPSGGLHLTDYTAPSLSKAELIKLWKRSGNFVHRGSAEDLFAAHGTQLVVKLEPAIELGQKILNLLQEHLISSADKKTHILATLLRAETRHAHVLIAKSP